MEENMKVVVGTDRTLSYLKSPTVEVIVEQVESSQSRSFYIHADILRSRSIFFKDLIFLTAQEDQDGIVMAGRHSTYHAGLYWRQGKAHTTLVIELPLEKASVFETYIQLLYTGVPPIQNLPAKPDGDNDLSEWKEVLRDSAHQAFSALYKLYALCTRLRDDSPKRILLAALLEMVSMLRASGSAYLPDKFIVMDVYDYTAAHDPLRMFLVDCYVWRGTSSWVYEVGEKFKYPRAFLDDFIKVMLERETVPGYASRLADARYYQDKLGCCTCCI